jgi:glyoxylase-like metal-dependent hydrolase (beta-lactamase superfamily II)
MSWYFFIVVGYGRVVLVDCGTDAFTRPGRDALRRRWSIRYAVTVEEALGRLGLAHDDVTDVVLTHHHWDHVGALGELTSARVHANVDEWRAVPPRLRRPVESSGRFRPINGPRVTLWPGFLVREAGLHTAHHSMVEIDCENGGVVIVSDAAYLYQSIDEGLSSAVSTDPQQNVRDVADAVLRVERDHVLPGHDPEIFARHPSGAPGVALICR